MLKEVTILGQKIKIIRQSLSSLSKDEDSTTYGYYSCTQRAIYIAEELEGDAFRRVLLHELMHAFLGVGGLSATMDKHALEEGVCDLAESFIHLFQNKQFVSIMTNKKGKSSIVEHKSTTKSLMKDIGVEE